MKKIAIICLAAASLTTACDTNDEIDRSIWISDSNDYNLPEYSEWGYNTFGAKMGRNYFVSCWHEIPCALEWHGDNSTLELTMNGRESSYYGDDMSLTIIFPCDSVIDSNRKLYLLDGKTIDLTDPAVKVVVGHDNRESEQVELIEDIRGGELYFKHVQLLYIDDKFTEAIISGTFDIRYKDSNGQKCTITNGRFDLGITDDLFW